MAANGNINYDRHARRRMRWRRISEEEVEETIRNPDRLEPTNRGRTNAFRWMGDRHIRVTLIQSESGILVITVVDLAD